MVAVFLLCKKKSLGVSFFDQCRINQAIAACGNTEQYIVVKGNLKGIQGFIYSDINKDQVGEARGTARQLRGKSFFVSLLTEVLADHLLYVLQLPKWNLLFAGGGHFNVLIPTSRVDELQMWIEWINLQLSHQLEKRLGLIVGSVACTKSDLKDTTPLFDKLNQALDQERYCTHANYLKEFFYPSQNKEQMGQPIKPDDFVEIGKEVPNAEYLLQVFHEGAFSLAKEKAQKIYSIKEKEGNSHFLKAMDIYLLKEVNLDMLSDSSEFEQMRLIRINNTDFLPKEKNLNSKVDFGFFFIGNYTPTQKTKERKEILDFTELSKLGFQSNKEGNQRLAAFRLDVDDLGTIFSRGLPPNYRSIAHFATLSRELNLFFTGYVNHLARRHDTYIVYSGGDDAFVVASWINIIHFALDLYRDFKKFTRDNSALNFSGGIYTCHSTYPIFNLARDAEEKEKKAKAKEGKNSISAFNHVLKWENFVRNIELGIKLEPFLDENNVTQKQKLARSLIHRILRTIHSCFYERDTFQNNQFQQQGTINTRNLNRNIANLHHLLARHGFTDEKIKETQDFLHQSIVNYILQLFQNRDTIRLKNLTIALNYIIYKLRN